ncbi:MAG: PLD nuclease N-terminal domain-containing protein [Syntrophorhabdaceae bacterium]
MIGVPELIVCLSLGLLTIPSFVAFIDIIRSDFEGNKKTFWLLFVIFFSFIGAFVYFIIGRKQRITK